MRILSRPSKYRKAGTCPVQSPPIYGGRGQLCAGFTLVEMLVSTGIIIILMSALLSSISKSRVDLNQEANYIIDNIRKAQNYAVSAKLLSSDNTLRCGYGITRVDATTYAIYAGPNSSAGTCASQDRDYSSSGPVADRDVIFETLKINNPKIQFQNTFNDFFFEPPDPKTFVCTSPNCNGNCDSATVCAALDRAPITITIQKIGGANCPSTDCKNIYVYTSGRIQVQ